ncbi:SOUL family heme-binding protein [Rubritalea tangerina]|uniref:SOUL family heme-binding protein n=2 Tax=Rubritalea tangerina TaxID=430798 RepID=A0ABW4Z7Z3_9BACT
MQWKPTVMTAAVIGTTFVSASAIEKPAYESLKKDGKFELRQYGELHIVTATMTSENQRNQAFRKLAGYIGQQNDRQQKIAMTAPVLIDGVEQAMQKQAGVVKMSFVIPQAVVKAGIPKPTDNTISLSKVKGGKFAVTSFKSSNSEKARKDALEKLRVWMAGEKLKEVGEPSFAFYNPPWIPQMFRTNEVWVRVK